MNDDHAIDLPTGGQDTPRTRRAEAGAVLRRTPPDAGSDPRQGWRLTASRNYRPIVDTTGRKGTAPLRASGSAPPSSIVDNSGRRVSPDQRRGIRPGAAGTHPDGAHTPLSSIVDNPGRLDVFPRGSADGHLPSVTRFNDGVRHTGRAGPDEEKVKAVHSARKRKLRDRALALGRDPGANSSPSVDGMTRSEKTHEGYLVRGRQLIARYRRHAGLGRSGALTLEDPIDFVNWFFSLKPNLTAAAWRPYRQSAKAVLATIPHDDAEKAVAMIESDYSEAAHTSAREPEPEDFKPKQGRKLPRRTSALKEKRFPKADFDRIISYLKFVTRSKHADSLVDWMMAGVSTGLRPIEWQATDLEIKDNPNTPYGREVYLYVVNAKSTNGRANGAHRTIDLTGFTDETLEAVQRMSSRGMQWLVEGRYDDMQSQHSQLLYSACNTLFKQKPKVYALYSLRHQFVANAKNFHEPAAISAMCGHIVTDTAMVSYGKKRSGWGPDEVVDRAEPLPEEVATVRQQHKFFDEHIRHQQEAGLIEPGMGFGMGGGEE
jgi:hypothetical protein